MVGDMRLDAMWLGERWDGVVWRDGRMGGWGPSFGPVNRPAPATGSEAVPH